MIGKSTLLMRHYLLPADKQTSVPLKILPLTLTLGSADFNKTNDGDTATKALTYLIAIELNSHHCYDSQFNSRNCLISTNHCFDI